MGIAALPLDTTGVLTDAASGGYGSYRYDTRTGPPDLFEDLSATDWPRLTWRELGRPYEVKNYSNDRADWEAAHGGAMPVPVQWEHFNKRFHSLFEQDVDAATVRAKRELGEHLRALDVQGAREVMRDLVQLKIWNKVHLVEDAVWDPRGKRALFDGMKLDKPNILFLGAADGYEAMQLLAMYSGHAVLVDYDDFCRTYRFGTFPEAYPFLGYNAATGGYDTYRRADFDIDFEVADIRDLKYGREFDLVVSIGLIEHFPDDRKAEVFDFHRRFLKPGGYAVMTTPRKQVRSKLFYLALGEIMNYGYRELMDARQLGLYAYENGFEILRAGTIKAHNGLVCRAR